ncbi:MAG: hypothetical protein KJO91_09930, partial [Gammaproteobacteria bacterium]|nr:hypothetical protein [Gammaproteobacteria bacterium]
MKRYDPSLSAKRYDDIMIECVNGEWVRYEDAQAIIDDLQARLDRWNHGGNYIGTNAAIKARDAENEALRKDADRWRDLVSHQKFNNQPAVGYAINRTKERFLK